MRRLLMATMAMLLSGCVTEQAGRANLFTPSGETPSAGFSGLASGPAPAGGRYVFLIHGMGDTGEDFGDPLLDRLVQAGFKRTQNLRGQGGGWIPAPLAQPYRVSGSSLDCPPDAKAPPCRFDTFGGYKIDTFERGAEKLHVYRYYWHAALLTVQKPYIANDELVPRARINGGLKQGVVNYGFTDAAAYIGSMGGVMRAGAESAVCAMMRDASRGGPTSDRDAGPCTFAALPADTLPSNVDLSFISMSLGSRLLVDTLAPAYERRGADATRQALRQTSRFFMLANQLPLLGIGCVEARPVDEAGPGRPTCQSNRLAAAIEAARPDPPPPAPGMRPWPDTPPLDVVSFQDPDDLLGFRLTDAEARSSGKKIRFTQVVHRNTPQRTLFGYTFADPRAAHATELERLSASRLIVCGGVVEGPAGRVRPASDCLSGPGHEGEWR